MPPLPATTDLMLQRPRRQQAQWCGAGLPSRARGGSKVGVVAQKVHRLLWRLCLAHTQTPRSLLCKCAVHTVDRLPLPLHHLQKSWVSATAAKTGGGKLPHHRHRNPPAIFLGVCLTWVRSFFSPFFPSLALDLRNPLACSQPTTGQHAGPECCVCGQPAQRHQGAGDPGALRQGARAQRQQQQTSWPFCRCA